MVLVYNNSLKIALTTFTDILFPILKLLFAKERTRIDSYYLDMHYTW